MLAAVNGVISVYLCFQTPLFDEVAGGSLGTCAGQLQMAYNYSDWKALTIEARALAHKYSVQWDLTKYTCHLQGKASELRMSSFDARQLRQAGFDAAQLRQAGFDASPLLQAGFNATGVRQVCFNERELHDAGFDSSPMRQASFASRPPQAGSNAAELNQACVKERELRHAGFDASPMHQASFDASRLLQVGVNAAVHHDVQLPKPSSWFQQFKSAKLRFDAFAARLHQAARLQ